MRIALLAPYSRGPLRGNIITVDRIARHLRLAGAEVLVLARDRLEPADLQRQAERFRSAVVHGFHAQLCGAAALCLADLLGIPSVVTLTGSDIFDPQLRERRETAAVMQHASTLVCFDGTVAAEVAALYPQAAGRLQVIHQGVESLEPVAVETGLDPQDFVVLLPAALRPVKGIETALDALQPLAGQLPGLRLVVAGGIIDSRYAAEVLARIAVSGFAVAVGEIPHDEMGGWYTRADLVLNCSRFEGGMANSLLEAMALGRPVLAADITGNRALVTEGESGWLFRSAGALAEKVAWLAARPEERERVGQRGAALVREQFSPEAEAAQYLELYCRLRG